jgi:crotonobetainyl-CoA:carnitine CoA-transferase CaiB-like acyl-CoA transferase
LKLLQDIVVLDFTRVLAGPFATQICAELGADVIKVERPKTGDECREWEPRTDDGDSAYFFSVNRGKRSITLDLKSRRGAQIAFELASKADVVVENFLPGHMKKLGLGYEALAEVNPRLVYVSCTGFGQTGPYRDRKGYDTIFQALSGLMSLTGAADGPPAKAGLPFADLSSGLWAAISMLAGLVGRGKSGRGCFIDLSMMDVQVSLLTIAAARLFALGEEPTRCGTEHLGRVPSAAFECRNEQWVHISGSDQHWVATCEVLNLTDLAADESLRTNAGRLRARDRIMTAMRAAIGERARDQLVAQLIAADVPVGEVNSVREVLDDPHVAARGMQVAFERPGGGEFPALRQPLRITGAEQPDVGAPPQLGAHTREVLRSRLAMDERTIEELALAGVI